MYDWQLTQKLEAFLNGSPACVRLRQCSLGDQLPSTFSLPRASLGRQKEWFTSRRLEAEIREDLAQKGSVDSDSIFTSVSHTRYCDEIWTCVVGAGIRVGVDLEVASRVVDPHIARRVISPTETHWKLSLLEFWVVKESIFKANPTNTGTFLSQYTVTSWNEVTREGEVKLSEVHGLFKLIQIGPWQIAFAYTV